MQPATVAAAGEQVVRGEKGGRTTRIPLRKAGRKALLDLLRIRREMGCIEEPDAPLVVSRRGDGLSVRSYQDRMRNWCRAAGLPMTASPHWLRHTLAKRVMADSTARDPRGVVMGLLNHASIASTAVYTMPDREELERALDEAG